jgi:hypothetical protein
VLLTIAVGVRPMRRSNVLKVSPVVSSRVLHNVRGMFPGCRNPDDEADPTILHIYARHLTTIDDALRVWFNPDVEDHWNERHQRFEVETDTHILYWTWLTPNERVLIITCLRKD